MTEPRRPSADGMDGHYTDTRMYTKKVREAMMDREPTINAVRTIKTHSMSIESIAEGVANLLVAAGNKPTKLSLPTCRNWIMRGVIPTQKKHRDALIALAAILELKP